MFSMLRRHEVQLLVRAGVEQLRIKELLGVSPRSVTRIADEPPVTSLDDQAERRRRKVGRPSKTEGFVEMVRGWLKDQPDLRSVEIIRRMQGKGYTGKPSAAYQMIAGIRECKGRFVARFEGLPGEFTQHDFGEVIVRYQDGRRGKIHFFATRLKYSRWVEVTIVPNQRAETLIRAAHRHFEAIGGIPLLAVFDRPKTIAKEWRKDGTVTKWNPTFEKAMFGLGMGVELCWPASPEQKGSVENLVKWVKGSFFTQRYFVDYDDLLFQLQEWLVEVNTKRPSRATGVIPAVRLAADQARLRPLKVPADDFALVYPGFVGPTAEVSFEGALYTMPPAAVGMAADLHVYPARVRIVAGKHVAMHDRQASGGRSILPEHRADQLAAVSGRRGRNYLRRQHLLDLGEEAVMYLSEVVHRRPRDWYTDVNKMHALLEKHGDGAMLAAIERALVAQTFGWEYVGWFLGEGREERQRTDP